MNTMCYMKYACAVGLMTMTTEDHEDPEYHVSQKLVGIGGFS